MGLLLLLFTESILKSPSELKFTNRKIDLYNYLDEVNHKALKID